MKLELFVRDKRLTRKGLEPLVGDTAGYYTFTIAFDEEWDDLVKVVVFQNGKNTAQLIYKGESPLPAQVCGAGDLYVACHGYRKLGDTVAVLRTVRMVKPLRLRASGPLAGDPAETYTPTVFEQVMAAVGQADNAAAQARKIKTELEQARDAGEFNGQPGPQGQTGDTGPMGPAGPAPVRGEDYWTQEDQQTVVRQAVALTPTASWEQLADRPFYSIGGLGTGDVSGGSSVLWDGDRVNTPSLYGLAADEVGLDLYHVCQAAPTWAQLQEADGATVSWVRTNADGTTENVSEVFSAAYWVPVDETLTAYSIDFQTLNLEPVRIWMVLANTVLSDGAVLTPGVWFSAVRMEEGTACYVSGVELNGYDGFTETVKTLDGKFLPVATDQTLGGVMPVLRTEDMTSPVGVDALGGLWAAISGGLSQAARTLLIAVLRSAVYTADRSADITALEEALAAGEEDNSGSTDTGGEETEKTLTAISATYSGGSVTAGTAVTALTGIVVTASYSDGTTGTVTGYTLSGTIAEGENTITVTYQGKTAAFTVTGVAAGTEPTQTETLEIVPATGYPNVTTFAWTEGTGWGQYAVAKQGTIQGGVVSVSYDPEMANNWNLNFYVFDADGNPYCQTDKESSAGNTNYGNLSGDMGEIDWESVSSAVGFGIVTAPFSVKIPDGCTFIACIRRGPSSTGSSDVIATNSSFTQWAGEGGVTFTVSK